MVWAVGYACPTAPLAVTVLLGGAAALDAVASPDISGVWAIVSIAASLSLIVPTIYGVALHGPNEDTEPGAAGRVMATLGGAQMPLVHGALTDAQCAAFSSVLPAACSLVMAALGVFELTAHSRDAVAA